MPPESEAVDYEGEMALVIGRTVRRVSGDEALAAVAGYTVANDVTMRDYQYKTHQWLQGKSWASSTPLGPFLVTPDEVGDPHALDISLTLNGETMQSSNTSRFIFDIPTLIGTISEFIPLNPGDVVLTGTPEGSASAATRRCSCATATRWSSRSRTSAGWSRRWRPSASDVPCREALTGSAHQVKGHDRLPTTQEITMPAPLFGQEHADRYRETDGEEGHDWQGTTVLLLTTTGRKSGAKRTTPLIYQRHGDDYLVVASNGGGDPPGWFLNLQDDPIVDVQVKADHHTARARVATAEEKPELWRIMTATGTPYDDFQAKADREIPVVVLEPTEA